MNMPVESTPPKINVRPRRRGLTWGIGAAALLAGAGLAWRQASLTDPQNDAKTQNPVDLWNLQFKTLSGESLSMHAFRGKPLLLNFWATWCPPCVEELPLLDHFFQENNAKGWQVLGLAVDKTEAVRQFVYKRPLSFPIGVAGTEGTDLSRALGNLAGALPFTVVFNSTGNIVHRKMGVLNAQELQTLIRSFSS